MGRNKDEYRREQAFRLYAKLRNVTKVSEELDIPLPTLFGWKKEDKWDERIGEVVSSIQGQIEVPMGHAAPTSNENAAIEKLSKSLSDEISSLDLMSQTADAAVATKFKDMSLQQVIKIKEFVSKQRVFLLHELQSSAKEQGKVAAKINTKNLDEKIQECIEMKRLVDRLDPGWDKDLTSAIPKVETEPISTESFIPPEILVATVQKETNGTPGSPE